MIIEFLFVMHAITLLKKLDKKILNLNLKILEWRFFTFAPKDERNYKEGLV